MAVILLALIFLWPWPAVIMTADKPVPSATTTSVATPPTGESRDADRLEARLAAIESRKPLPTSVGGGVNPVEFKKLGDRMTALEWELKRSSVKAKNDDGPPKEEKKAASEAVEEYLSDDEAERRFGEKLGAQAKKAGARE